MVWGCGGSIRERAASNHQGKVVGRKPGKWNLGALTGTDGAFKQVNALVCTELSFQKELAPTVIPSLAFHPLPRLPFPVATRQMSWDTSMKLILFSYCFEGIRTKLLG